MQFANIFRPRNGWKRLIYYSFAVVCFAQSDPGPRGGAVGAGTPFPGLHLGGQNSFYEPRSATVSASTAPIINYIQGNYATPQTPQSVVNVTFNAAQAAGDLNVVVVGWKDSTAVVRTVTDKSGNTYTLAIGPTVVSGSLSQSIYYAKNIRAGVAGANIVTVAFSVAAAYPDIRILEYRGADLNNPIDVTAARHGNSTTSSSGLATTTNPTDLILGANVVATPTNGPGSGFTSRIITSPDGDIAEDRMVTATGSYRATARLGSAGPWIMQMVAIRTPVSGGDTTPPTTPTNLIATTVSTGQINLSWTASADNVGVTAYLVERCQGAGCTNFAQIATSAGSSYSDNGLTANTSYSYRLRATDAAGNLSPYSNLATATTQAPGQLSITPSSANFGNVPLGSSSTQSVVLKNTGTSSITISQANVAGREFSISGLSLPLTLAAGQMSTFSAAFTPSGAGTVIGSVSLLSNATNSPTAGALSGTGVHNVVLSWHASISVVAGYNVYRGSASGGPYTKVNPFLVSGTTYMDPTVQAGQTYYYVATALDSSNSESAYSTEVSGAVPSP